LLKLTSYAQTVPSVNSILVKTFITM